ncbi:MAG: helix-turn-helix domain-containing protein, partial [Candidatus Binataceae bacterium]
RAVALAGEGDAIGPELLSARLREPASSSALVAAAVPARSVSGAGANAQGGRRADAPAKDGPIDSAMVERKTDDSRPGDESKVSLWEARAAFEADFIAQALGAHQRNISRAARALGVSRAALQKKMKEYGLR